MFHFILYCITILAGGLMGGFMGSITSQESINTEQETYTQTSIYICDIDMDTQFIVNKSVNPNWYISKYGINREVIMRDMNTDRASICTPLYR